MAWIHWGNETDQGSASDAVRRICRLRFLYPAIYCQRLNVAHTIDHESRKLLQEISMDAITQNFAYIELLVSDVKKAAYVLDEKLGINNFKIIDINVIRIYDVSISVERVSKVLAENNVGIEGVTKKQDTLEDYFLKLTRE